jgi:hypothetical protein
VNKSCKIHHPHALQFFQVGSGSGQDWSLSHIFAESFEAERFVVNDLGDPSNIMLFIREALFF